MIYVREILKKYPTVALHLRDRQKRLNDRGRGFKHFLTFENHTVNPREWYSKSLSKYDTFITSNQKFCEVNNIMHKSHIILGNCAAFNLDDLESFIPYENKIKGICQFGKSSYGNRRVGSIYYIRQDFLNKAKVEPYLVKHLYNGSKRWGGSHYKGRVPPHDPFCIEITKKVNEYLFCFCPENTYHPIWSWGYMTERLFRCFRAKTVAIYMGCYNIDEHVPKDLYIDFRDFFGDYDKLADYLIKFPKEKYIDMTERAFAWNKTHRISNLEDFENTLKGLPQ